MSSRWLVIGFVGAALVLAALVGPYFTTVADQLPIGPHDWKQADCLAVAQRFLEDDSWNLLDPRVLSLFPPGGHVNFELPLVPYLAAAGARMTGEDRLVVLMRSLTLAVSLLGPLAVFGLLWSRAESFVAGILPTVFVAASPVFASYATSFLPDAPAFGLMLCALALMLGGERPPSPRRMGWGIAVLTLAGLMKMSFAFYLLIPAVLEARRAWRGPEGGGLAGALRRLPRVTVVTTATAGLVLVAQVVYLQVRAAAFFPTFATASPHPVTSMSHLAAAVRVMRREWLADLFTAPQLIVLLLAVAVVFEAALARRRPDDLAVASAVCAVVMVVLFVLFGHQLGYHDYYAIAVFQPLATLLVVRLTLAVRRLRDRMPGLGRRAVLDGLVLAGVLLLAAPLVDALSARTSLWWRMQQEWLRDARRDLDRCGERCEGPVAVLGVRAPNLALVYLDRRGYVLGRHLGDERGSIRFAGLDQAVDFMDQRGVRVLVMRWQNLARLPQEPLRRAFEAVDERGGAAVFVRAGMTDGGTGSRGAWK